MLNLNAKQYKKGGNVKVDLARSLKTLEIEDQQHGTLMYLDVSEAEMHAMTQQQRKYQQNRDRGPPQEHKDARSYYRRGYQQTTILLPRYQP